MKENKIDGASLKECILAAAAALEANKKQLNDLNVFPVPDGDTGTNMSLTMKSVVKEVQAVTDITVKNISAAAAKGALKGARGNSGVILSQLYRGFAVPLEKCELIDSNTLAAALRSGVDMAYKAVMKPKEGTILTVARVIADTCVNAARAGKDIYELTDIMLSSGKAILNKTPEMLPVLKKAGVVDAGGQGLLFIYTAYQRVINGEYIPDEIMTAESFEGSEPAGEGEWPAENDLENITFAYCTEFFIENLFDFVTEKDIDKLRRMLGNIGDSLVVVGDVNLVKVHVHTNTPGKALQYALQLGELNGIKIENMVIQHRELMAARQAEEQLPQGIVAVAAGKGLEEIFKDIGASGIIPGGQTMNPSTEDIFNAVQKVPAKSVIVLPNNSNIILAAQQVNELTEKEVYVVPTKSIPQGIVAMLAYNPEHEAQENFQDMCAAIDSVKTGQVTYAVRDTEMENKIIKEGDILGLYNGKIAASGQDIDETAFELLQDMYDEKENDLITVYYGQDVSEEQAEKLRERLEEQFDGADVELHNGGQPLYYYILSVE
ncbi:MAG: DAK2 domain-containing protein [Christensenellaceae bacterium]|nr:DAK2 domain-containing protein [Christensenellaceae bacterium]